MPYKHRGHQNFGAVAPSKLIGPAELWRGGPCEFKGHASFGVAAPYDFTVLGNVGVVAPYELLGFVKFGVAGYDVQKFWRGGPV